MLKRRFLVRSIEAERLFQNFLISAVASVLAIRVYLQLTGYIAIDAGGLHVAHMLWGGLLMLIAILLMLTFIGTYTAQIAAVIGGLGFGAFIDELGKFITHDNNYFFQPAVALIYVVFVVMYLGFEIFKKRNKLSEEEYLINALELTKEAVHKDLDTGEKQKALKLLRNCNPKDPIVKSVKALLHKFKTQPIKQGILSRTIQFWSKLYQGLIKKKWFAGALVLFFIFHSIVALWNATSLIEGMRILVFSASIGTFFIFRLTHKYYRFSLLKKLLYFAIISVAAIIFFIFLFNLKLPALSIMEWGEFLSSASDGAFVVAGIFIIRQSRLKAYRMFKYAILISIFLTQFFVFYREQVSAVVGLFGNILILFALQYMIDEEERTNKSNN